MVDDDDEEYDNNQFSGYNDGTPSQNISKRMKQSPRGKK
jgi:hypothetical protein